MGFAGLGFCVCLADEVAEEVEDVVAFGAGGVGMGKVFYLGALVG